MKKLIQVLFAGLFASLLVTACGSAESFDDDVAADEETTGKTKQAAVQPCQIWLMQNPPPVQVGNELQFTMDHENVGSAGCNYKFSVDVFSKPWTPAGPNGGTLIGASQIYQGTFLNPGNVATRLARVQNVSKPCYYRVWFKYKPNYPNGSEQWFVAPGNAYNVFSC